MHFQYIAVFSIVLKIAVVLCKSDDSKIPMLQPLMPGMQPSNSDGMLQPILAGNHPGNHQHSEQPMLQPRYSHHRQQHPHRPISPMLDHHVYPHGHLPHPAGNIEMNPACIHHPQSPLQSVQHTKHTHHVRTHHVKPQHNGPLIISKSALSKQSSKTEYAAHGKITDHEEHHEN